MTKHAYVIGCPIGHSLSPVIHNAAFAACALDVRYEAVEVTPGELADWAREARRPDVVGFNVTVPHKEAMAPLVDALDSDAGLTGAVNTVIVGPMLVGANTDAVGFRRSLAIEAGCSLRGQHVVLLGAGGAARAIALVALQDGAASLVVANRHADRAARLLHDLEAVRGASSTRAMALNDASLAEAVAGATVLVNATSVGLRSDGMPIDPALVPASGLVVDIVYNPPETALLRSASARGALTLGGLGMLVYQAAAAFKLWTGVSPPVDVMRGAAERALRETEPAKE